MLEFDQYPEGDVFLERLRTLGIDVCLIDFDGAPALAFNIAERIVDAIPEIALFVVSSDSSPELIIQAMRSGCREYLLKPLDRKQLIDALTRVSSRRRERRVKPSAQ